MTLSNVRLTLWASLLTTVGGTLILTLYNTLRHRTVPFTFPATVPLQQAQLLQSHPLPTQTPNPYTQSLASHHYQYQYQTTALDIQMTYVTGTGGDLQRFLNNYPLAEHPPNYQPQGDQRQRSGLGFYQIYTVRNRTYLSACIDPGGKTTVTTSQFISHWNSHWYLLGQDYMDDRCLWTHLSIANRQNSPHQTEQILESAWFNWHQWWQSRFPPQQA